MCDKAMFARSNGKVMNADVPPVYYRISEIRLADLRTKLFDYMFAMEHGEKERAAQLFKEMQRIIEETKEKRV